MNRYRIRVLTELWDLDGAKRMVTTGYNTHDFEATGPFESYNGGSDCEEWKTIEDAISNAIGDLEARNEVSDKESTER